MPATTTPIDQHHSSAEGEAVCHPSAEARSRDCPHLSHPSAHRSVAEARVALLQAELREVCAERDRLREQVRTLERRRDELRELARAAMSEREQRDESSRQALVQRYERMIAEKNAHIEAASRSAGAGADDAQTERTFLRAVRDSLTGVGLR